MRILFVLLSLCFATYSTQPLAEDPEKDCEEAKTFKDLNDVLVATDDKFPIRPVFSFDWNEHKTNTKKSQEFTLTGFVEFPKTVSVADAFLENFLSEQAVMSVVHASTGVKTLNQDFDGRKNPKSIPEIGKVVPFRVTAQKCKFIICRSGKMESSCKFTEVSKNRSVLECAGIPNENMKSHSTKISCVGGANATTKCNFELKGQPGSKRYALGGAAESLYSFYGLAHRSVGNKFNESDFEKTGAPDTINSFYKSLIDASDKNTFTSK